MLASSALIAVSCGPSPASQPTKPEVLKAAAIAPFPEELHWTLELNNPLVASGFVAYGGSSGYFPIAGDRIVAIDLLSGAVQWTVPALPRSPPAFADGRLFIEEAKGLAALEAKDGSVAWRIPLSDALAVPLASDHGRLVAVTAAAVLMFRGTDGSLVWRHDLASSPHGVPGIGSDGIFVPVTDGRVIAFQADTGEILWEYWLGGAANDIVAFKDRLFVGSNDHYLYCLDAGTGERVWRTRTGADVVSRPTVDERRVYFVSLDNVLRALNQSHGVQQWKRSLPFRPAWPPINVFDAIVVGGLMGPLKAYYLKDGTPAGEMSTGSDLLAARFYAFESPAVVGPMLVVITHNVAGDAKITAVSRKFEPAIDAALPTLPGAQPLPAAAAP
jgi:outer membrane protein assembly factor BamB